MDYAIRQLTQQDEPFLWEMLYEAAHMAEEGDLTVQDARNHPELARYVSNWGLKDDMGFVATLVSSQQSIGAVWLRLLAGENQGYGFVDEQTPELAIAVYPEYRNQGIGTELMTHLLAAAQVVYPSISLSTRQSNPALHLYQKLGWEVIPGSEKINRVGGISLKMKLDFKSKNITNY
ncbi:GNAT family N-acetyltransferase [Anabaena minutissima FACHB-250]|nr:GNAT family N-acetyltransferase [Anabaena minutissima FACHB-250]